MKRTMLGVTLCDKKRISWIRQQTGVGLVIDIIQVIRRANSDGRDMWWEEGDNRWTTRVTELVPREHKRSRGRPRTKWHDDLNQWIGPTWMRTAKERDQPMNCRGVPPTGKVNTLIMKMMIIYTCTLYTRVYQFQTVKFSSWLSGLLVRGFFSFHNFFVHNHVMTLTNPQKNAQSNCFFSVPKIIASRPVILIPAGVVGMTRARGGISPPSPRQIEHWYVCN